MKLASCTWLIFWSSFFPASGKLAPIFGSLQNEFSCLKLLLCIHLRSLSTSPAPSSMIFSHIVLCVFCFSPHTPSTTTHTHTHTRPKALQGQNLSPSLLLFQVGYTPWYLVKVSRLIKLNHESNQDSGEE